MTGRGIRGTTGYRVPTETEDGIRTFLLGVADRLDDNAAVLIANLNLISTAKHVLRHRDTVAADFDFHDAVETN